MNKYEKFLQEVTSSNDRKFSAKKSDRDFHIDARSDGGVTVTVGAEGKYATYIFDATELKALQQWLQKE